MDINGATFKTILERLEGPQAGEMTRVFTSDGRQQEIPLNSLKVADDTFSAKHSDGTVAYIDIGSIVEMQFFTPPKPMKRIFPQQDHISQPDYAHS